MSKNDDMTAAIEYEAYAKVDQRNNPLTNESHFYWITDLDKKSLGDGRSSFRVYSNEHLQKLIEKGKLDDPKYVVYRATSSN